MTETNTAAKTILFASTNPGKIEEIKKLATQYDITVISPLDLGIDLHVIEDGVTFEQNAIKKAEALRKLTDDQAMFVFGDDSGIEIAALDNKPGVFTRRWAGYEMKDQEIVDYCLDQLKSIKGEDRAATFKTTIAVSSPMGDMKIFNGRLPGTIREEPSDHQPISGMPFNTLFYIPEIDKMLVELHGKTLAERDGFMTHRERALHDAFMYVAEAKTT